MIPPELVSPNGDIENSGVRSRNTDYKIIICAVAKDRLRRRPCPQFAPRIHFGKHCGNRRSREIRGIRTRNLAHHLGIRLGISRTFKAQRRKIIGHRNPPECIGHVDEVDIRIRRHCILIVDVFDAISLRWAFARDGVWDAKYQMRSSAMPSVCTK